jgi:primosomal protein N' (replication factor Y)
MTAAVRVAVESPLMQLDREFDFLVPDLLQKSIEVGQRVSFRFGRNKQNQTGFVIELLPSSRFATSALDAVVSETPVLTKEIYLLARRVADRQCVAIGEILTTAIPSHMPRVPAEARSPASPLAKPQQTRQALLTGKQLELNGVLYPSWMPHFLASAQALRASGYSSILLVPEAADADWLARCANALGIGIINWESNSKSDRFRKFHALLNQVEIVIGARSAIYAPVANLALIAQADDADDSYTDLGSPHTTARDLVLMRAEVSNSSVLFAAPYRSVEVQRLVEIGYLDELDVPQALPRISYAEYSNRIDDASIKLARECLLRGTLLVLLPRKGTSAAAFCINCGERIKCTCGGFVWEPADAIFSCRICSKVITACLACRTNSFRRGRSGSTRTFSEIGKMFPGSIIFEATGLRKPEVIPRKNQIVIATPGSAPRMTLGYSGLIVLDSDIWLMSQGLRSEQRALRDWCEAFELLAPDARIHFSGLTEGLGKPLALGQHREMALEAFLQAKKLRLPPAVRLSRVNGAREQVMQVVEVLERLGGEVVRNSGVELLFRYPYQQGPKIALELRGIATAAKALRRGDRNVRGFSVIMDDGNI